MKEKNKKGRELSGLSDRTAMKIGIGITILGLRFMAFGIRSEEHTSNSSHPK